MQLKRKLHQYIVSKWVKGASQETYNAAWSGTPFVLDARCVLHRQGRAGKSLCRHT
jgi:hypothetical protein